MPSLPIITGSMCACPENISQKGEESQMRERKHLNVPAPVRLGLSYSSPEINTSGKILSTSHFSLLNLLAMTISFYSSLSKQNKPIIGFLCIHTIEKRTTKLELSRNYKAVGPCAVSLSGSVSLKTGNWLLPPLVQYPPYVLLTRKKSVHIPPNLQQKIPILSPTEKYSLYLIMIKPA